MLIKNIWWWSLMRVLRDDIENLRDKLSILILCKELTDIEVIICS
jgi:hypothetical protein